LRRAKRLRKLTGNNDLKSEGEIQQAKMTFGATAKSTLIKPFILNFAEAVVFANNLFIVSFSNAGRAVWFDFTNFSTLQGFVYAILYTWFEAFPLVYVEMYGMSLGVSQLPFIALFIGSFVGYIGMSIWHKSVLGTSIYGNFILIP
jgi:DHA1 family multidrug resistance protein-like MFS transporter